MYARKDLNPVITAEVPMVAAFWHDVSLIFSFLNEIQESKPFICLFVMMIAT